MCIGYAYIGVAPDAAATLYMATGIPLASSASVCIGAGPGLLKYTPPLILTAAGPIDKPSAYDSGYPRGTEGAPWPGVIAKFEFLARTPW